MEVQLLEIAKYGTTGIIISLIALIWYIFKSNKDSVEKTAQAHTQVAVALTELKNAINNLKEKI